jgi:iron(III) transport system substrate-binding protein
VNLRDTVSNDSAPQLSVTAVLLPCVRRSRAFTRASSSASSKRVIFINKAAKNINAAKLWLDYTLSKRGQTAIANDAQLYAIRADVKGETTSADLLKQYGASLKPLPVSPMLLQYLDQGKRLAFLKQWKDAAGKK